MLMQFVGPALSTAALALSLEAQAVPVSPVPTDAGVLDYTVIGRGVTFANPRFAAIPNATAHQQDMVVEHAGWQYVAYWNADRYVALARRSLRTRSWETLVLTDYKLAGENAHDTVNVGVCGKDGTIHLAFDHHVDPLHYRVSIRGLATTPAAFAWQAAHFGAIRSVLDPRRGLVKDVTYPKFIASPSGGLQLAYREFGSGNGRARLVDYDPATPGWSNDRVFVERTGAHSDPLGGRSTARNPYFNRIAYDDQGTLHATWTWRERASKAYNRDIAYAYSPDGGQLWFNSIHAKIADTGRGMPITASSPGVNAVKLGAEWGLMNNQAQAVDQRGRVHVVMYHKTRPDTTVSYGNLTNSHYHHFWTDADGFWRRTRLPTIGNRPKLFVAPDGALILAYMLRGVLKVDRATPTADYRDWQTVRSHAGPFGTSVQGAAHTVPGGVHLTIGAQIRAAVKGASTDVGVLSGTILQLSPKPATTVAAIADAYVRGGIHARTNYGKVDRLLVKDDGKPDFDRETYLKFDVSALRRLGTIRRIQLVARKRVMGAQGQTTPYVAFAVVHDVWSETSVTWSTRPPMGTPLAAHFGRDEMQWDVTTEALRAVQGDGVLSIGLRSNTVGADRILHLWSRESANAALVPQLHVFR